MQKQAIEKAINQASLAFFNHRLFLVLKPNNKLRAILDLTSLNKFLKSEKFKMETSESIKTSLQTGEWLTSIDFKDAYFHIPDKPRVQEVPTFSRQRSHLPIQSCLFCPQLSTIVVKKVEMTAQNKGIRIHQYLHDWLVRATPQQTCL